eukprot:1384088-Ditylum_brightwellii.AAC.1
MCTSYGNVTIEHTCNSRTMCTTPDKILSYPIPQLLQDIHHEDHCHPARGIIGKGTHCQLECTAQDIVNNELNRWNKIYEGGNHASIIFPIEHHCLDVYAM